MTITQMLGQSGLLTLLGLGVVFSFLIILILSMYALHGVLHLFKLDQDKTADTPAATGSASTVKADEKAVVAAIAAAIRDKTLNS